MDILYHEASILTRVPARGKTVTLDDLHRFAWQLFTRGAPDTDYARRPFVFRADPVGDRVLLTLRSDRPFTGATPLALRVATGDTLTLDLCMIPTRRRERREYTPPSSDWPNLWAEKLALAGLTPEADPAIDFMAYWSDARRRGRDLMVMDSRVPVTIDDESALATAWLDGVGRRRAYGMGLLRLTPDSQITANAA